MDKVDSATRSRIMRAVKGKNTKPELLVRSLIHRMGYRFRLHRVDLPGKPDIVFPSRKKIIFVHGCFWHGHDCKHGSNLPQTNSSYWRNKINRNRKRDKENYKKLSELGWKVLVLWECQLGSEEVIKQTVKSFLEY